MHAHVTEVLTEARLHERARRRIERLARRAQDLVHNRRRLGTGAPAPRATAAARAARNRRRGVRLIRHHCRRCSAGARSLNRGQGFGTALAGGGNAHGKRLLLRPFLPQRLGGFALDGIAIETGNFNQLRGVGAQQRFDIGDPGGPELARVDGADAADFLQWR